MTSSCYKKSLILEYLLDHNKEAFVWGWHISGVYERTVAAYDTLGEWILSAAATEEGTPIQRDMVGSGGGLRSIFIRTCMDQRAGIVWYGWIKSVRRRSFLSAMELGCSQVQNL